MKIETSERALALAKRIWGREDIRIDHYYPHIRAGEWVFAAPKMHCHVLDRDGKTRCHQKCVKRAEFAFRAERLEETLERAGLKVTKTRNTSANVGRTAAAALWDLIQKEFLS